MGLCIGKSSQRFVYNERTPGQGAAAEETFTKLGLTDKEIQRMYNKFHEIDVDGSGEVDLEEFFGFFQLVRVCAHLFTVLPTEVMLPVALCR